jgi:hypothetical protein
VIEVSNLGPLVSTGGNASASRRKYLRAIKSGIPAIAIKAKMPNMIPLQNHTPADNPFSIATLEQRIPQIIPITK